MAVVVVSPLSASVVVVDVVVVVVVVVVLGIRVDSVHAQVGLAKGAVDASAAVHRAGLLLVLDALNQLEDRGKVRVMNCVSCVSRMSHVHS